MATPYIGNPAFQVHTQSGTMRRALKGRMLPAPVAGYRVSVDTGIAPHAIYVIRGTRVMLGRDVLWSTASAPETKKRLMKTAVRLLGRALRTQATVRFEGSAEGSLRATIVALNRTGTTMQAAARETARVMGEDLLGLIRENISLTDHSLSDLAALDHPYARRHGSIRIHG